MKQAIDLDRFRRDLDHARIRLDTTWSSLARMAGVSPAMFTRINKGAGLTLEAFARLCAACHLDPADYMPAITKDAATAVAPRHKEPYMDNDRLECHGTQFTIGDLHEDMRPAWRNGPRRFYWELDGMSLGYVAPRFGGYYASLENTRAWQTGPHDSERSAIESLFRMIGQYYDVDDPPAHARGIAGFFDERNEISRLCEAMGAAYGEHPDTFKWVATDAVRQIMDLADMLEQRHLGDSRIAITMNDSGHPVACDDPMRVEVLVDLDNGISYSAGIGHFESDRFDGHPSLIRIEGGETTDIRPLHGMLDDWKTVDLIDATVREACLIRRDPWIDDLTAPPDISGPDPAKASTADPWTAVDDGALPTPDPAMTPVQDAQSGPGIGM